MKYSNHAKIIDPKSEYYGQVFEVMMISLSYKYAELRTEPMSSEEYPFSEIQFCVTKDNEPVKIGNEVVCLGDLYFGQEIYNFVQQDNDIIIYFHGERNGDEFIMLRYIAKWENIESLHPTNKVKTEQCI